MAPARLGRYPFSITKFNATNKRFQRPKHGICVQTRIQSWVAKTQRPLTSAAMTAATFSIARIDWEGCLCDWGGLLLLYCIRDLAWRFCIARLGKVWVNSDTTDIVSCCARSVLHLHWKDTPVEDARRWGLGARLPRGYFSIGRRPGVGTITAAEDQMGVMECRSLER